MPLSFLICHVTFMQVTELPRAPFLLSKVDVAVPTFPEFPWRLERIPAWAAGPAPGWNERVPRAPGDQGRVEK